MPATKTAGIILLLAALSYFGTLTYLKATHPVYGLFPRTPALDYVSLEQDMNFIAKYKAWFAACDYTSYSCIGVKPPKVVTKVMRRGLLGVYRGGDTIEINRSLRGTELHATLMHEMVHYLQVQKGGLVVPGPAKPICEAEAEAFKVVDQWLSDHGYSDLTRGPDWWRPYAHCRPFYGSSISYIW